VVYTPWCDERGKVIDDGTVTRIAEETWRWTSADPSLRWFTMNAAGLEVAIEDVSERVAAIAVQGPTSRAVLQDACEGDVATLRYFRMTGGAIAGVPVHVSRTGYTGDLGYEVWMDAARACDVWDALMTHGRPHDIRPAGMLALDVARIEAGLLLTDVDFVGSRKALIDAQRYTPFELGLGRLVADQKGPFVGQRPLAAERAAGHRRQIVGLEVSWPSVERLYDRLALPTLMPTTASRAAVPVYKAGRQIGRATSTTWSPTVKKLIALATLDRPHFAPATAVDVEVTVEAVRHRVPATVVPTPFFNPPRKTGL
jgi:aminomethyltransferase